MKGYSEWNLEVVLNRMNTSLMIAGWPSLFDRVDVGFTGRGSVESARWAATDPESSVSIVVTCRQVVDWPGSDCSCHGECPCHDDVDEEVRSSSWTIGIAMDGFNMPEYRTYSFNPETCEPIGFVVTRAMDLIDMGVPV